MRRLITQPDASRVHPLALAPAPAAAMACLWSRRSTLNEIWDVMQTVETWPGVTIAPDRDGLRFTVGGGAVLAHLHWNGRIDLPFAPYVRERLVAEDMVGPDPDDPDADHVVFDVRTASDVDHAVWLLRLAYLTVDSQGDTRAADIAQSPGACE
jgi:hypothetical protein